MCDYVAAAACKGLATFITDLAKQSQIELIGLGKSEPHTANSNHTAVERDHVLHGQVIPYCWEVGMLCAIRATMFTCLMKAGIDESGEQVAHAVGCNRALGLEMPSLEFTSSKLLFIVDSADHVDLLTLKARFHVRSPGLESEVDVLGQFTKFFV